MDWSVSVIAGIILRYLYDAIKKGLKLSDTSAAWGTMLAAILMAVVVHFLGGTFAPSSFPIHDPVAFLESLGKVAATVYATAVAYYSLTKKREGKPES